MTSGNTYKIIFRRVFLTEGLPEPLKPNDNHLQITDKYFEDTRIRLRQIRVPETNQRTNVLEQRNFNGNDLSKIKYSQMFLNEAEYKTFARIKGSEIRKNRYFIEVFGKRVEIDIFLKPLQNLSIANVYFETEAEAREFKLPDFALKEITNDEFFTGENLAGKEFEDVR